MSLTILKPGLAAALLAGLVLLSCKKDDQPNPGGEEPGPAGNPSEIKVTLPSGGALSVCTWKEGDKLNIGGEVFTLSDGAGTKTATFKGKSVEDKFFTISLPSSVSNMQGYLNQSFEGQVQTGNGSTAHLVNTVFINDVTTYQDVTLSKEWAESKGGSFRSNGVLALNLTLPADAGSIQSISIGSAGTKFPMNNSGDRTADAIVLNLGNVSAGSGPVKAYIAVSEKALEISPEEGIKITVEGDMSYNTVVYSAISMGEGKLTEINVSDASAWNAYSEIKGDGTESSPYILKTAENVEKMMGLLENGKIVWFELGADIDMKDVLNWLPLNTAGSYDLGIHFDGKGHTISNFSCSDTTYPSFFGVLYGYCGNVTFDGARISSTSAGYSMGVVGGYAGANSGLAATVENVIVKNSTVSTTVQQESTFPVGGIFGTIVNTTVKNCSFDGTVDNKAYGLGTNPDRCATAGIAAKVNTTCSIENCSSAGSISSERCRYTGGIAGWVAPSEDISIKGCTNTAAVSGGADRAGGIVGHYQQGTVENCVNKGAVSCNLVGSVSGAGGIVGYSGPAKIIACVNEGNVSGTKNAVGGIIGYAELVSDIERCYSIGDVTSASGRFVGGIAGGLKVANSSITNCWSSGKVEATADQEAGGIVGSVMTGQKVSCCYSTAKIVAQRVAGGIVARACNNGWTYSGKYDNSVTKCIAWNPSVTAMQQGDTDTAGGSGVVVGFTSFYNTLSDCWRSAALQFTASDTVNNVAVDQPDCSPENPFVMGTTPGTSGKYGCPYHGKVAPVGATVSSLATQLGWDASVWDLSASLPVLKK